MVEKTPCKVAPQRMEPALALVPSTVRRVSNWPMGFPAAALTGSSPLLSAMDKRRTELRDQVPATDSF